MPKVYGAGTYDFRRHGEPEYAADPAPPPPPPESFPAGNFSSAITIEDIHCDNAVTNWLKTAASERSSDRKFDPELEQKKAMNSAALLWEPSMDRYSASVPYDIGKVISWKDIGWLDTSSFKSGPIPTHGGNQPLEPPGKKRARESSPHAVVNGRDDEHSMRSPHAVFNGRDDEYKVRPAQRTWTSRLATSYSVRGPYREFYGTFVGSYTMSEGPHSEEAYGLRWTS